MRTLLAVLLFTLFIAPALAAGKKEKGQRDVTAALQKKLSKSDLPADVREKASKVIAEHGPKVREAKAASDAVLTTEQKSARAAAQKAAKEAGKKRKEAAADVVEAAPVVEEEAPPITPDDAMFTANNIWMMVSTFLVFIMHLGFATLETGLTRAKNTVNILFKNTAIVSIGLVTYAFIGFNLMYPGDFQYMAGWFGFTPDALVAGIRRKFAKKGAEVVGRTAPGFPETPFRERMGAWDDQAGMHLKFENGPCAWFWSTRRSTLHSGLPSGRLPRRLAVRPRPCGNGCARPSGTQGDAQD